jgi:serine/threonine protein kinase
VLCGFKGLLCTIEEVLTSSPLMHSQRGCVSHPTHRAHTQNSTFLFLGFWLTRRLPGLVKGRNGYKTIMPQTLLDNRYARGELLGSGGMAEVYLAHDEVLDRDVALKVLSQRYTENEEFVERFRREARNAAFLNHPHIVSVYDQGCSGEKTYYIAMEYITGGTLKDRILGEGPLAPDAAIELGLQVAQALGHAHEHGVIHRDIKSRNILLTEAGYAKVTDFGIARAATATTTTSRSRLVLGTPGYISPEQAMGKPVDPRSDLYSLGVVLYEMLTGSLPYGGESPLSMALKHVDEPLRSPREVNPNVPASLNALTAKLLAKNPENRYASASDMAEDLERVRSGLSPLVVDAEKTTREMVTAPLLSTGENRPKRTALRPLATSPMEVFKSGRTREGKLIRTLATLLFSMILLGALVWALMGEYSALETSGAQDTPDAEEVSPSSRQEEVPELYYASEVEDALADAGLKLGTQNEASDDTVPAGVVIEQDPAAGSTVEEDTAVDIVVSTGPKQVPTPLRAAPARVGVGSQQEAPATQAKPNSTNPKPALVTEQSAPQALPISVETDSQQEAPNAQKTTAAQAGSAFSSVNKTVQKEKKKGKK